jgi:signal transduction histidine kinase
MINRLFGTMLGQILAVIAASSAVTFFFFLLLLFILLPTVPPPPWPWPNAYRIVALIDMLHAMPDSRASLITAATSSNFSVRLNQVPIPCPTTDRASRDMQAVLDNELHDSTLVLTVRSCGTHAISFFDDIQVLAKVAGNSLEIRSKGPTEMPVLRMITLPLVVTLLFLCTGIAGMSAWVVWRVIGPLRRLSAKADAFGQEVAVAAIAEDGPLEIRRVTRAFNLMQERIARSMHDRTRMLAAISHDLRTPLTRMRLQLEMSDPNDMREKMLRNLGLMQSMVSSALTFLSGSFDEEERERLDLAALLLTLRDEFEEAGYAVHYEGPERLEFFCRPNAIARAVTNLVENACHFGTKTTIKLATSRQAIIINVEDDGPGIPEDRKPDVIEPFVRLDPSRSARPGSVGLGLSIVQEIVKAHHGTLKLVDRIPCGLVACMEFPLNVN